MNRTKRQANSIITYFTFYMFLTFALIIFIIQGVYPDFMEMNNKKQEAVKTYNAIQELNKTGVSYSDFIKISKGLSQGAYTTEILDTVEKDFYNNNFKNTGDGTFQSFLEEKIGDINNSENIKIRKEQDAQVSKILPAYSEALATNTNEFLTDFQFINYVESLIETFNLTSTDSIGINKIVLVNDFKEANSTSSLANNIYYIPLHLKLTGGKSDILQFLHFVENVGKISIQNDDIAIYTDNVLNKNGVDIVIKGNSNSFDYNIYENQIIDIEELSMIDYIDGTYIKRRPENQSLTDFIEETQAKEKYTIEVKLRFYVKGLQYYKIEETIKKFLNSHSLIKKLITQGLKDTDLEATQEVKYKKVNTYLQEVEADILKLKKSYLKGSDIESIYKNVVVYDDVFFNLYKQIGLDIALVDLSKKYSKEVATQNRLLEKNDLTNQQREAALKTKNFLNSIHDEIQSLEIGNGEDTKTYLTRLNNKNAYEEIMNLHFLLDNNK